MPALRGRAAADSRCSWIGRSDRTLRNDGSWTRLQRQGLTETRKKASGTPAESLKPKPHSPPKIGAKLTSMLLRLAGFAKPSRYAPPGSTIGL